VEHDRLLEDLGSSLGSIVQRATCNVPRPPSFRFPGGSRHRGRHAKTRADPHVFATDSVRYADRRKYALLVLANVFGGGMSSRLFQRIREELGSLMRFMPSRASTGRWRHRCLCRTQPKTAAQAAAAIREEYAKLARTGLTGEALAEAKQQTQGQLMLSLESPSARMYRLAGFPVTASRIRAWTRCWRRWLD